MIRVLVDSSADFTTDEIETKKIDMVPLTITINDQNNYRDELDLKRKDLYTMMLDDKNRVKTSQPSPQEFLEKFQIAKDNGDELICILLSSSLSGTCQSATLAKEMVDYDKIYIIDSLTATVGIRILADYALRLIEENKYTATEIVDIIEATKSKIKIKAGLDTLKFLYLGGRVSKTTAIVADAITIKPSIYVSVDGYVCVANKYLGVGRAIADFTKQMKSFDVNKDFPIYILYSHHTENAEKLHQSLLKADIPVNSLQEIGATIGVHVGPGVFGYVYVEN